MFLPLPSRPCVVRAVRRPHLRRTALFLLSQHHLIVTVVSIGARSLNRSCNHFDSSTACSDIEKTTASSTGTSQCKSIGKTVNNLATGGCVTHRVGAEEFGTWLALNPFRQRKGNLTKGSMAMFINTLLLTFGMMIATSTVLTALRPLQPSNPFRI